MNIDIKVRGVAVLDGKLLCVQLKPYNNLTAAHGPFWCLPGGGVDDGEPLVDAFRREMVEELGAEPKVGRLLYVQQFSDQGRNFLEFIFHIENAADYANVDLGKTTHGTAEIEKIDFIDPEAENVRPKFLATEDLQAHIDNRAPVKFFS